MDYGIQYEDWARPVPSSNTSRAYEDAEEHGRSRYGGLTDTDLDVRDSETVAAVIPGTSANLPAPEGAMTTMNSSSANVGEYVDLVITAVTAQIDNPRRALGNIGVERASVPVTTTVGDPVVSGINTVGSRTEECNMESHRIESNVAIALTRSQSAERDNEAQQAQMSDPDPREQLQVINGVQYAAPVCRAT